jgi:UDP-glucose 4-epimerase
MPTAPLTILVTGGAGYIGAASADALIAAGHRVVILDDLSTGHAELLPNEASAITGTYTDRERVGDLLRDARIDAILHCAAKSIVSDSVEHPERYYRDNLIGSLNLLDAAMSAGIKRIVFSSSAAVYGAAQTSVLGEESAIAPINPYGATKAAFEHAMRSYAGANGAKTFALRYFNVAGATERVRERHQPETHLLPRIVEATLAGGTFSLFGTDYATPDGTAMRDYVHVADVAAAHVAAFDALGDPARHAQLPAFTALNIGSGVGTSVRQAIAAVERATGTKLAVEPGARRAGDPPRLVADVARAAAVIGWRPRQSDIGRIVRSLVPGA